MKRSRKTKKTFIFSLCSLVLYTVVLISSTFAWFNDTVINKNNHIVAGNLDIELYRLNGTTREKVTEETKLFNISLWEPGAIAYENFEIANEGDLSLNYEFVMKILNFNTVVETGKSLKDVLKVAFIDGEFSGNREDINTLNFSDPITNYIKENTLQKKGSSDKFAIVIYWEPGVFDNDCNLNVDKHSNDERPLYINLGVNLIASQKSYEADTFGSESENMDK